MPLRQCSIMYVDIHTKSTIGKYELPLFLQPAGSTTKQQESVTSFSSGSRFTSVPIFYPTQQPFRNSDLIQASSADWLHAALRLFQKQNSAVLICSTEVDQGSVPCIFLRTLSRLFLASDVFRENIEKQPWGLLWKI